MFVFCYILSLCRWVDAAAAATCCRYCHNLLAAQLRMKKKQLVFHKNATRDYIEILVVVAVGILGVSTLNFAFIIKDNMADYDAVS